MWLSGIENGLARGQADLSDITNHVNQINNYITYHITVLKAASVLIENLADSARLLEQHVRPWHASQNCLCPKHSNAVN